MATLSESDVIAGVVVVDPDVHGDERGRFVETYRRSWFEAGREMVQGNRSDKEAGALTLALFHHDPAHGDDEMDRLLEAARKSAERAGVDEVIAAAEGQTISFERS